MLFLISIHKASQSFRSLLYFILPNFSNYFAKPIPTTRQCKKELSSQMWCMRFSCLCHCSDLLIFSCSLGSQSRPSQSALDHQPGGPPAVAGSSCTPIVGPIGHSPLARMWLSCFRSQPPRGCIVAWFRILIIFHIIIIGKYLRDCYY